MFYGVNIDPGHYVDPDELAAQIAGSGFTWVRSVLKWDVPFDLWLLACHAHSLRTLIVVARESLVADGSFERTARAVATIYKDDVTAFQIGNEADHIGPSSWTMPGAELTRLGAAFRSAMPDATLICAGMADGRPEYLDDVDLSVFDAIGVHGYGRRPNDTEDWAELPGNFGTIGALLDEYARFGKPIYMSEIGVTTDEVSEAFQARYAAAMVAEVSKRSDVEALFWFCYSDLMA